MSEPASRDVEVEIYRDGARCFIAVLFDPVREIAARTPAESIT